MSRTPTPVLAAALGATVLALTSCSSGGSDDGAGKPLTKQLAQGELAEALPGDGEVLPGWEGYHGKSVTKGEYCTEAKGDASPRGFAHGSDAEYIYHGSTNNMMFVNICQFDTPENAQSALTAWKGTEKNKQRALAKPVGDESVLVVNPGLSEDSVYAFSRSATVNIRVKIDGAGGGTTGAQDMLMATLMRLQQVQDGKRVTVTTDDVAAEDDKK